MNRVRSVATVEDPAREKAERERAEEARIRATEQLERRQVSRQPWRLLTPLPPLTPGAYACHRLVDDNRLVDGIRSRRRNWKVHIIASEKLSCTCSIVNVCPKPAGIPKDGLAPFCRNHHVIE